MQLEALFAKQPKQFAHDLQFLKVLFQVDGVPMMVHGRVTLSDGSVRDYLSHVIQIDTTAPEQWRTVWVTIKDFSPHLIQMISRYLDGELSLRDLWNDCSTFLQRGPCLTPGPQIGIAFDIDDIDEKWRPGPESYIYNLPHLTCSDCGTESDQQPTKS